MDLADGLHFAVLVAINGYKIDLRGFMVLDGGERLFRQLGTRMATNWT
jgi:hypothetical protein